MTRIGPSRKACSRVSFLAGLGGLGVKSVKIKLEWCGETMWNGELVDDLWCSVGNSLPISCQCVLQGSDSLQSDTEETPENLVKNGDFESGPDKSILKEEMFWYIACMWRGRLKALEKWTELICADQSTAGMDHWVDYNPVNKKTGAHPHKFQGRKPLAKRHIILDGVWSQSMGDSFCCFSCFSLNSLSSVFAAHCDLFRFCLALLVALTQFRFSTRHDLWFDNGF